MITVIAATPSSPSSFIIVTLNRNVVTAAEHWLTISDAPLEQLFRRTSRRQRHLHYVKDSKIKLYRQIIPAIGKQHFACPQSPDDLIQKQKPCRFCKPPSSCVVVDRKADCIGKDPMQFLFKEGVARV